MAEISVVQVTDDQHVKHEIFYYNGNVNNIDYARCSLQITVLNQFSWQSDIFIRINVQRWVRRRFRNEALAGRLLAE